MHVIAYFLFVSLLLLSNSVQATSYTFPGNLPAGCSGSSGTYTCGALTLGSSDSITIAAPMPATITVNGNMSTNITPINVGGSASNLNLVITGTLSANGQTNIQGNVTAGTINDVSGYLTFGGSLSTSTGSITLNYQTTVAGTITSTSGNITIGQNDVIGGAISSTSGAISIGYAAQVTSVTTNSTITFAQNSSASGCAKSSGSAAISLGYQATVNSVCCGSSCSNSCVTNNSTYAMPQQCIVSSAASLVSQYHFEESSWTGASGEVKDSSGNNLNGKAVGLPLPTPATSSPAIGSSSGTCGYASIPGPANNGGAFSFSSLPVSTNAGAQASVAFWAYWDGVNNPSIAIGWSVYNLELTGNYVGFNTGNGDLYGPGALTLTNGWHHFVAIFVNGSVTSNKLYIDGVNQTLSQTFGSQNNGNSYVNSSLTIAGWGYNTSYRFSGRIDEVQVYSGSLTASQVTTLYTQIHTCPVSGGGVVPGSFNCVEVGGATTGSLYTKLANAAFNLDVLALTSSGSVDSGYVGTSNKSVTLELVNGAGVTACASRSVLSSALTQTVAFTGSNNGRKTVSIGPVNYAYPDVRCRVTDANQTPNIVSCSSDDFAIRPSNFTVSASASADAIGTSATATPVVKTGASFSMTATSDALGYNTAPNLNTSFLIPHSGAVQSGGLSGSFNSAVAATGVATNSTFNYSEVGYFALTADGVYDSSFTAVDSAVGHCTADFSNTLVSGQYGCKFGNTSQTSYFGRFIPDHLLTQVASHGSFAHACSSFTYNGQPLGYGSSTHPMLTIYPYNTGSVTKNYTGKFNRLLASQFVLTAPTTDAVQKGADNSNLVKLNAVLGTPTLTDNGSGNLTLILGSDIFTYQRESNALIAPFSNAIAVKVNSVSDSDGVSASNLPIVLQPSGENIYYGRVNLMNANGSELVDLAVPMVTEYFNGSSFITNGLDTCSVATLKVSDPLSSDSLLPTSTCIWDSGGLSGSFKCSGSVPTGETYVEGTGLSSGSFNLYLMAPGQTGPLTVSATVANWLMFNWQGLGMVSPSATVTFGIYKGNSKQIFFKEVY